MGRLEGKVAVVTGAGSGNGRAIAVGYAREGAKVLMADVNESTARETADMAQAEGCFAHSCWVDVSKSSSVQAMLEVAEQRLGGLDILVSNAGIMHRAEFLEHTEEDFDKLIAVNLRGVFVCGLYAARRMAQSGGTIINIASVNSEIAASNTAAYCASKGGVQMLTRSMAVSLAPHGIRVNAIGPGTIRTNINRDRLDLPGAMEAEAKRIPLGRVGAPEDLIGAAVFLASDDSAYITGHTLFVDGGFLITWNPEHPPASSTTETPRHRGREGETERGPRLFGRMAGAEGRDAAEGVEDVGSSYTTSSGWSASSELVTLASRPPE